jgi:hypothetical protein
MVIGEKSTFVRWQREREREKKKNLLHAVEAASRSRSLCSEVGDSPESSLERLMIDDG